MPFLGINYNHLILSISISTFDWTRKTNIIIHGFNDAFNSWYCTEIKNRLLELVVFCYFDYKAGVTC